MNQQPFALIYTRVSGEYDNRRYSLESQRDECLKLAKSLGYIVPPEFIFEEQHTGKHLHQREELNKARDLVREGKAEGFIVYDTDRLSRGGIGHLTIVVEEIYKHKGKFLCVLEPYEDTPEGRLLLAVRGYRAEIEKEKIKDRTMRGRRKKINEGHIPGQGGNQYGYRLNKETWKKEIYEPEAMIVRRIYALAAEGKSTRAIATLLNEEGAMTPSESLQRKLVARCWHSAGVGALLKQTAYKGQNRVHVWTVDEKTEKMVKRPPEEIVYLPGTAPAIVSEEVWDQANGNIKKNVGDSTRNERDFVLLRGLVWCRKCGKKAHLVRGGSNLRVNLFRCSSHLLKHENCHTATVSARWLSEMASKHIFEFLTDPERIARMRDRAQQTKDTTDRIDRDIEGYDKRLKEIELSRERIGKRLSEFDEADADIFHKELARLRDERDSITKARAGAVEHRDKVRQAAPTFPTLDTLVASVRAIGEDHTKISDERKRALIEAAKVRVLFEGRKAWWQLPDGLVVEMERSASRLRHNNHHLHYHYFTVAVIA